MDQYIDLPVFGHIDLLNTSLPVLAVILGLVDGFNPCAMWVLVFMITVIVDLKCRKKIWTIVGSFLFASGVLYYLFMTAWLNAFLFIGYIYWLTLLIGVGALYAGIMSVHQFLTNKVECDVGDLQSRNKTKNKIKELAAAPLTIATFLGIVALAFTVNAIEFVCSAALPAIYTNILSLAGLSVLQYYLYILLYVLFFMLDDIVIFSMAALTVDRFVGDKYVKYCKLIGGAILITLGIMMIFFQQYLR